MIESGVVKTGVAGLDLIHRTIPLVEARGCPHEFDTREFTVGSDGITLINKAAQERGINAFQGRPF